MFLSSLHCTDEHYSLLDDCTHSQLGLAVCDEDSGLAGAKCFGKEGECFAEDIVFFSLVLELVLYSHVLTLHSFGREDLAL